MGLLLFPFKCLLVKFHIKVWDLTRFLDQTGIPSKGKYQGDFPGFYRELDFVF